MNKYTISRVYYRIYIIPQNTLHLYIFQGLRINEKMPDFCSIDFHMDIDMKCPICLFVPFSNFFL